MHSKKTLSLLRTLTPREFSDFEKYLNLNLANQETVLQTFKYLKRFYPLFNDEKRLNLEYAYRKITKEVIDANPSNRKNFLNILSDINACIKAFLVLNKMNNSSLEGRLLWSSILMERRVLKNFSRSIMAIKNSFNKNQTKSVADFIVEFITNYLFYYKVIQKKTDPNINAIQDAIYSLDQAYKIIRLKLSCEAAAREDLLITESQESDSFFEFLNHTITSNKVEDPILEIYQQIYFLIKYKKQSHFSAIWKLLKDHKEEIDIDEQHVIISYLQNHNTSQIRQKKLETWIVAHDLNKFGVAQQLFARKGTISHTQFNNIVSAACKTKDYDWALDFVKTHQMYLGEKIRNDTTKLSEAIVFFEMGHFDNVLPITLTIEFLDIFHTIRAKALTLMTFYELDWNKDKAINFCNSFLAFIKRDKKLRQETKLAVRNFINFIKELFQSRLPQHELRTRIENSSSLYFSEWFIAKVKTYKMAVKRK